MHRLRATEMHALHTWGELSLSPIGLSLVNKLAPAKFGSLLMAVWFLGNAFANYLAGVFSSLYPDHKRTSIRCNAPTIAPTRASIGLCIKRKFRSGKMIYKGLLEFSLHEAPKILK